MTRDPRTTFATSIHRADMEKMSATEAFLVACDYSLLIFAENQTDPMSVVAGAQMIAARQVLEILKTIGNPAKEPKPTKPHGLDYSLK